jgi:hypothetical protein
MVINTSMLVWRYCDMKLNLLKVSKIFMRSLLFFYFLASLKIFLQTIAISQSICSKIAWFSIHNQRIKDDKNKKHWLSTICFIILFFASSKNSVGFQKNIHDIICQGNFKTFFPLHQIDNICIKCLTPIFFKDLVHYKRCLRNFFNRWNTVQHRCKY